MNTDKNPVAVIGQGTEMHDEWATMLKALPKVELLGTAHIGSVLAFADGSVEIVYGGADSRANAIAISNYPFGFNARGTMYRWIETERGKRGWVRGMHSGLSDYAYREGKPTNDNTFKPVLALVRVLDPGSEKHGHVIYREMSSAKSVEEIEAFIRHYGPGLSANGIQHLKLATAHPGIAAQMTKYGYAYLHY